MQISDSEVKKILAKQQMVEEIIGLGKELDQREADRPMVKRVTKEVINAPDREDRIAELKARIESGDYNPTSEEIAEAMIRRNIADKVR